MRGTGSLLSAERLATAERLRKVEAYGKPRRVWVDDGTSSLRGATVPSSA